MSAAASTRAAVPRRRVFVPLLGALVVLSWALLWAWSESSWARYLDHGDWSASGPAAFLCRAIPGGDIIVPAATYALAWVLMTAAMMLPTTWPLFDTFDRLTAQRADHGRLLLLLGLGYGAVWGGFGLLAHGLHLAVSALFERVPWLAWNGWLVGAGIIALAGAFQFSALKRRCLEKCRAPLGFVIEHWRGSGPARQAFALGAHHGLFCVGCCWALMLLMFAVGAGNLLWMLALAALMAVEKNVTWGARLSTPLGVALLAWAAATVAAHA